MTRFGRILVALLTLAMLVVLLTLPAIGQDEGTDPAPTSEETVAPSGLEPAVPIPAEVPTETIPDWTYRYMIPSTLVLAAAIILFTSIRYFTNVVRKRYRTVQE